MNLTGTFYEQQQKGEPDSKQKKKKNLYYKGNILVVEPLNRIGLVCICKISQQQSKLAV